MLTVMPTTIAIFAHLIVSLCLFSALTSGCSAISKSRISLILSGLISFKTVSVNDLKSISTVPQSEKLSNFPLIQSKHFTPDT